MEFVYNINENEIEVYIPGLTKDPVKLPKDWVEKLAKEGMEKFGLDYDTAFYLAIYFTYVKMTWMNSEHPRHED